jgi:hypothetical protein
LKNHLGEDLLLLAFLQGIIKGVFFDNIPFSRQLVKGN